MDEGPKLEKAVQFNILSIQLRYFESCERQAMSIPHQKKIVILAAKL